MSDSVTGIRPAQQPEDDAAREARHQVLATLLAAYADGELPVETASQIDAHLLGCGRCRSELRVQRALSERLSRATVPAATAALQDRIRLAVASAPVPAAIPMREGTGLAWRRRAAWIGLAVMSVVATVAVTATLRDRAPHLDPPPLVASRGMPVIQAILDDYRRVTQGDLPGRARDLDAVRQALPFPVMPIKHPEAHLLAAWTADLDGEPAGVLAYRWNDRVVLQYIIGETALFRTRALRTALAEGRAVVAQDGVQGLLAWPDASAGAVLVADAPWQSLVALGRATVH